METPTCLQADVIEVQFAKLVAALAELRDLKAASRAHEEFLTACTVQSCLDVPQFSIALANILATCKAFCAYVQVYVPRLNKADVKLAHPEWTHHKSSSGSCPYPSYTPAVGT